MGYYNRRKRSYNDYFFDDDFGGYNDAEYSDITFYRPDGNTEGKSISWCKSNGFFEIEEGLWSGDWYWKHFPNAKKEIEERRCADIADYEKRYTELLEKQERRQRSELLDRADSEDPNLGAVRDLATVDGEKKFECPLSGCRICFVSEEQREQHLATQRGKGHSRYRQQYGIKRTTKRRRRVENMELYESLVKAMATKPAKKARKSASAPDEKKIAEERASMQKWLGRATDSDEKKYAGERASMKKWLSGGG